MAVLISDTKPDCLNTQQGYKVLSLLSEETSSESEKKLSPLKRIYRQDNYNYFVHIIQ